MLLLEVSGPTKGDRLIDQLGRQPVRSARLGDRYDVADSIGSPDEILLRGGTTLRGDVVAGRRLVESARKNAVVLYKADRRQKTCRHPALGVDHDRFVDLNVARIIDALVMRFLAFGGLVVVVAGDRSVRRERAGLEDDGAAGIAHRQVDPRATRGVSRR